MSIKLIKKQITCFSTDVVKDITVLTNSGVVLDSKQNENDEVRLITTMTFAGTEFNFNDSVSNNLTSCVGIGNYTSNFIAKRLESNAGYLLKKVKLHDLTDNEILLLERLLKTVTPASAPATDLIKCNVARLLYIRSYRGKRHFYGLPTRAQRTRDNAQNAKKVNKCLRFQVNEAKKFAALRSQTVVKKISAKKARRKAQRKRRSIMIKDKREQEKRNKSKPRRKGHRSMTRKHKYIDVWF